MCTAGGDDAPRRRPAYPLAGSAAPRLVDSAVALWCEDSLGWLLDARAIRVCAAAKDDDLGAAAWILVGDLARALAQVVHFTRAGSPAVPVEARSYAREARRLVLLLGDALPWVGGPALPAPQDSLADLLLAGPRTEPLARVATEFADELGDTWWTDPQVLAGLVLDAAQALGEFGRAVRVVDALARGRGHVCGTGWRRARRTHRPRSPRRA